MPSSVPRFSEVIAEVFKLRGDMLDALPILKTLASALSYSTLSDLTEEQQEYERTFSGHVAKNGALIVSAPFRWPPIGTAASFSINMPGALFRAGRDQQLGKFEERLGERDRGGWGWGYPGRRGCRKCRRRT